MGHESYDLCPYCQEKVAYDPDDYGSFPCPFCHTLLEVWHDAVGEYWEVPVHGLQESSKES